MADTIFGALFAASTLAWSPLVGVIIIVAYCSGCCGSLPPRTVYKVNDAIFYPNGNVKVEGTHVATAEDKDNSIVADASDANVSVVVGVEGQENGIEANASDPKVSTNGPLPTSTRLSA